MLYVYKTLGISIEADSRIEAIDNIKKLLSNGARITAISCTKKQMEKAIRTQTKNIISWWCLCWYLSHIRNVNNLLNHEKGKLKGLLSDLNEDTLKDGDTKKIKRKIFEYWWIDREDFDTKPGKVIAHFISKFTDEQIEVDLKLFNNIAKEFAKDIKVIIDLICNGTEAKIFEYVDNKFSN